MLDRPGKIESKTATATTASVTWIHPANRGDRTGAS
jgi:hypothetical protein